jgi:hypothetical protein
MGILTAKTKRRPGLKRGKVEGEKYKALSHSARACVTMAVHGILAPLLEEGASCR